MELVNLLDSSQVASYLSVESKILVQQMCSVFVTLLDAMHSFGRCHLCSVGHITGAQMMERIVSLCLLLSVTCTVCYWLCSFCSDNKRLEGVMTHSVM
jgi:hypothetical protein